LVRIGEVLRAFDEDNDTVWVINPFLFEAKSDSITLDWENTEYRWVHPAELASYDAVPKLKEAFDRVRYDSRNEPASLEAVIRKVKELEEDRIHGATFLGRQALALLSDAAQASDANDPDALFSHLLVLTSRLRRAQPAMANVWNLTGRLLYLVDQQRWSNASVQELKNLVQRFSVEIEETAAEGSENAARNSAQILPQDGSVLTHSNSSIVLRSLELGFKGGKRFKVYATESYPGMEGKQLAKQLIGLGVPVTLIVDSSVNAIIPNVDLVLVGADSILRDGSLVHKAGTRNIGTEAARHRKPVYSLCETIKFSAQDFLGDQPAIPASTFDVTPPELISAYVTEKDQITPSQVERQIKRLLKEIYS
jgi:translation initiation factor eIF-2B subunit delta